MNEREHKHEISREQTLENAIKTLVYAIDHYPSGDSRTADAVERAREVAGGPPKP